MSCRVRACEEVARNSTGYYKVSHRAREVCHLRKYFLKFMSCRVRNFPHTVNHPKTGAVE